MAKNRRTIITEIFDALGELEECKYDTDELWDFFDSCVEKKSLKKLSKERTVKLTEDGTVLKSRGKSGYQHFMSSFTDQIPEGENKRKYKTKVWYDLSEEERDNWNEQAQVINEENGIIKNSSDMNQEMKQFRDEYLTWTNSDPETRGPEPIRPGSNNSSDESSRPASPTNSDSESINNESNIDSSNVQNLTVSEEQQVEEQLSKLQISDSESEGEDDDEEEIKTTRIKWLKTLSWKSNTPSDFKAWAMFSDPEKFGPDKDTTLEGSLLIHYKNIHNYNDETAKSKDSPWNKFLKKNAIIV